MTEMALYYAAFAFTVLAVLSNRYWRRQIRRTKAEGERAREKAETITKSIATASAQYGALSHDASTTEARIERTTLEIATLSQELEKLKKSGSDCYYIFDRLEPRQGRFWEVSVRFSPDQAGERLHHRTWSGIRNYILVAESERDAKHRAGLRFPRKSGFEVVQVVGCRITNLSVNRVNDFSTFRRGGSGQPDDDAKERTNTARR